MFSGAQRRSTAMARPTGPYAITAGEAHAASKS